jgi:general secretion pathway protein M
MNTVRVWLDNLAERERKLVYAAAALAGVVLLYLVLVLPFQTASHKFSQRLDKKQTDLAWMRQVAPQVAAAAGGGGAIQTDESLVVLVDRTAREAGLGNSLRDQSPDRSSGLRLWPGSQACRTSTVSPSRRRRSMVPRLAWSTPASR